LFWVLNGGAANAGFAASNHQPGITFAFGSLPGDVIVSGDWYNNGTSAAAVYRAGARVLDAALPSATSEPRARVGVRLWGDAGDVPIVGKW
jgi:hypothetical protein